MGLSQERTSQVAPPSTEASNVNSKEGLAHKTDKESSTDSSFESLRHDWDDGQLSSDNQRHKSKMATRKKQVVFQDDIQVYEIYYNDDENENFAASDDSSGSPCNGSDIHDVTFQDGVGSRSSDNYARRSYDAAHSISDTSLTGGSVQRWYDVMRPDALLNFSRPKPPSRLTVALPGDAKPAVQYHIEQHPVRGCLLVFCATLGPGYDPSSVMVRANKSGRKIGLTACSKKQRSASCTALIKLEYHQRFKLPCPVDGGRLHASADSEGNVKIKAAIV